MPPKNKVTRYVPHPLRADASVPGWVFPSVTGTNFARRLAAGLPTNYGSGGALHHVSFHPHMVAWESAGRPVACQIQGDRMVVTLAGGSRVPSRMVNRMLHHLDPALNYYDARLRTSWVHIPIRADNGMAEGDVDRMVECCWGYLGDILAHMGDSPVAWLTGRARKRSWVEWIVGGYVRLGELAPGGPPPLDERTQVLLAYLELDKG